jgi:DUF1680 family protein
LDVNGTELSPTVEKGYAVLDRRWKEGDEVILSLAMPAKLVAADPQVKEDEGCRALQRGPLVYCLEEVDNPEDFDNLTVPEDAYFQAVFEPELLQGVFTLSTRSGDKTLTWVPYYAWDNREAGKMKVWIPLD